MVVTGDIQQTDRKEAQNGLLDFSKMYQLYKRSEYINMVEFNYTDIERHPAVKEVLDIYGDK